MAQVKLVDAAFIWTEPHSRRLKTKLTVQKEVLNGAILQQTFQVEYVVEPLMCLDCNRANANPNSWTACIQVRAGRASNTRDTVSCGCASEMNGAFDVCLEGLVATPLHRKGIPACWNTALAAGLVG